MRELIAAVGQILVIAASNPNVSDETLTSLAQALCAIVQSPTPPSRSARAH